MRLTLALLVLTFATPLSATTVRCAAGTTSCFVARFDCRITSTSSDAASRAWAVRLNTNTKVIQVTSATLTSQQNGVVTLKNTASNADIRTSPAFTMHLAAPFPALASNRPKVWNVSLTVVPVLVPTPTPLPGVTSTPPPSTTPTSVPSATPTSVPSATPPPVSSATPTSVPSATATSIPTPAGSSGIVYPTANDRASLGTNISSLVDWSFEYPFVDVFKASRPWVSGGPNQWDDGRKVEVDEHGWVKSLQAGQVARTLLFSEMPKTPPAHLFGDITILYEGEGQIEYAAGNDGIIRSPGRDVITFNPGKGGYFIMNITATNPANPLRNFRAILPGGRCQSDGTRFCRRDADCGGSVCKLFSSNYAEEPFHPVFLSETKPYGAIRFMDFMVTNHSVIRTWNDRPKLTDARWSTRGVPIEMIARLCNTLKVDGWFNIPHQADADYIRNLATTLKAHVDPARKIYVEYSNEVWNDIMGQAAYAREEAKRLGLGASAFEGQILYHARRTVEVGRIWAQVFPPERLVRVLGSFSTLPWVTERMLDFENVKNEIDAVAIAPYFGGAYGSEPEVTSKRINSLSVDELLRLIRTEELPRILAPIDGHRRAMAARNPRLELLAYEGGQHLVGVGSHVDDAKLNALFDQANLAPEMEGILLDYLKEWKARGGGLFMHFVNVTGQTKWGRWGALEYQGQGTSPKYRALMEFLRLYAKWW